MNFSKKMDSFQPGIFDVLSKQRAKRVLAGGEVFDLWVGTPDFKPAPHIVEAYVKAAGNTENFKYSLTDMPALTSAVIDWYKNRFGVELTSDEITSVNGSQEGIAHIALPICDPGDIVLVPNPGYPVFSVGPMLCGAVPYEFPLYEKNGFLPDFNDIPEDIAKKAKMMVVSYPANPVTAIADRAFYERLVAFAKKYDIIVIHDNAYSELVYDTEPGISFLSIPGAKDVGIEFNSLSKSYNMTGLRISFALGNRDIISKFKTVRSQIDYGVSYPVQYAAVAALTGPQDCLSELRAAYKERRDALHEGLERIGWKNTPSPATMFAWAPIPKNYTSSEKFAIDLLDRSGVMVVPGSAFGSLGEGFVRFALTATVERINEAVEAIDKCGILKE